MFKLHTGTASPARPRCSESGAEVVLCSGPIAGSAFTGEFIKRRAVRFNGLLEMLRVAFAFPQGQQDIAEIVLCHGPIERILLAGTDLEGRAVRGYGLFEALRYRFPASPETIER